MILQFKRYSLTQIYPTKTVENIHWTSQKYLCSIDPFLGKPIPIEDNNNTSEVANESYNDVKKKKNLSSNTKTPSLGGNLTTIDKKIFKNKM